MLLLNQRESKIWTRVADINILVNNSTKEKTIQQRQSSARQLISLSAQPRIYLREGRLWDQTCPEVEILEETVLFSPVFSPLQQEVKAWEARPHMHPTSAFMIAWLTNDLLSL